jgi:hypothetical protein
MAVKTTRVLTDGSTTVFFAGGLLFIRDGCNLQYVTSSSMVLLIYTKILNAAHIDGVKCGSMHFSASQLRKFAKSQVCTTISSSESKDKLNPTTTHTTNIGINEL